MVYRSAWHLAVLVQPQPKGSGSPRAHNKPEFGPGAPVAATLPTDWGTSSIRAIIHEKGLASAPPCLWFVRAWGTHLLRTDADASGMLNVAWGILEYNASGQDKLMGRCPQIALNLSTGYLLRFELGMRSVQDFGDCPCNPVELRIMR